MTIQDDINNFGPSCTAADLILLAAQTADATTDRIVKVATVNDLPDLNCNSITVGTVFFVESLQIPVIAQVGCWTGLDNRQVRNDFVLTLAYAWGRNVDGQLGTNSQLPRSSPSNVVGGFTDWSKVSAGGIFSLAMRNNGTVWAWGNNRFGGALGDNSLTDRSSPVSVVGGFTDWSNISAGSGHSLALRTDGSAWSWGYNRYGRLGNNTTTNRSSPAVVVGGFTDWCQLSAGYRHSLGVRTGGSAWAWGFNGQGRLGDNTTASRLSPVSVVGGFSDWCQVSAGGCHSLGVRTGGSAWSWGCNYSGQLGNYSTVSSCSPVSVVGGFADWCQLSGGSRHSLGVRTNGTAWAWGGGLFGVLGNNSSANTSSPVSVVGGFTNWCQLNAGENQSLAIQTNSTAWSWGDNSCGQLGDNSVSSRSSPVAVVGGFTWSCVSTGAHSLGIAVI